MVTRRPPPLNNPRADLMSVVIAVIGRRCNRKLGRQGYYARSALLSVRAGEGEFATAVERDFRKYNRRAIPPMRANASAGSKRPFRRNAGGVTVVCSLPVRVRILQDSKVLHPVAARCCYW